MQYFEQLGLNKEPFSNSPDPDFLYYSSQHIACLQELEIAVRLRRGLNVVIGEVGTGKTTLIRRFIKNMSSDETMRLHLVLDPYFKTPHAFLRMLCAQVLGVMPDRRLNIFSLKELLKKELYERGVNQDIASVLIVDEGQKMTPECLEVLRELLNYETNNKKLLQILLFGQTELEPIVTGMENLQDRINSYMVLKPLQAKETRAMIDYRLALATPAGEEPPKLLTGPAYWAIHRAAKGYPRKIVRLCHKVILNLLIRKKQQATFGMVNAVVREEFQRGYGIRISAVATACGALLICAGLLAVRYVPEARSVAQGIESAVADTFVSETQDPSPFAPPEGAVKPAPVKAESDEALMEAEESLTLDQYFEEDQAAPVALEVDSGEPETVAAASAAPEIVRVDEAAVALGVVDSSATAPELESAVEPVAKPTAKAEPVKLAMVTREEPAAMPESVVEMPVAAVEESAPKKMALTGAMQPAQSGIYYEYPEELGRLPIMPGESISNLIRGVYGVYDKHNLKRVLKANPAIRNVNDISAGKPLVFPVIVPRDRGLAQSLAWVRLAVERDLGTAYGRLRAASQFGYPSRLLPYIATDGSLVFAVVLERPFENTAIAEKAWKGLPLALQSGAGVMLTPNPDVSLGQMNDLAMTVLHAKFAN